jgi:DNA invertase Pin-like site-specific DNA recombinase
MATQRHALAQAATARGDELTDWFSEKLSGASLERPALGELRAAIRAGAVRRLYVFRLDRLGRSGIRDTLALVEEFRSAGCELVTIADPFSLDGPMGELLASILAWVAQSERLALGERIAAARVRVESQGKKWGRPARGDDELAEKARDMKVKENRSIRYISAALKTPRATVARMLSQKGAYRKRPEKPGLRKAEPPATQ